MMASPDQLLTPPEQWGRDLIRRKEPLDLSA